VRLRSAERSRSREGGKSVTKHLKIRPVDSYWKALKERKARRGRDNLKKESLEFNATNSKDEESH